MNFVIPTIYLKSVPFQENIEETEGYIYKYSFDEEYNLIYYYSSLQQIGDKEIHLTDIYLHEQTGVDYPRIQKILFEQGLNKQEQLIYTENNIRHPLVQYRAKFDIKTVDKQEISLPENDMIGAKVLLTLNPQYHKTPLVIQTSQYLSQRKKQQNKPVKQVAQYLNLIGEKQDLVTDKQQWYSSLIIKAENIPNSYFVKQSQVSEESGKGKIEITDDYKQKISQTLIKDQEASIDSWLEYLNKEYPTWYQIYVLEALKTMGLYDKEKNHFSKRRKNYVGTFPELNREALAKVYDYLCKYHNNKLDLEEINTEFLNLLKTGSFVRLYEYFLMNNQNGLIAWDKQIIDGEWVRYEQTENLATAEQLTKSLEGYNTGWCTAGLATAKQQLLNGDFYVYYSKNKLGFNSSPRVAIRMENNKVDEVRGIEPNQNLEGIITPIMKDKIKSLPGGEEYFIKTEHMETLTHIHHKNKQGKKLNKQELKFIYEIDTSIQCFGYEKDPRTKELKNGRNMVKDLAYCLNLEESQIFTQKKKFLNYQELENIFGSKGGYVHGKLDIEETEIERIPQNIKAQTIAASYSKLKELPHGTKAERLFIDGTNVKQLPKGLNIQRIDMSYTKIKELPQDIKVEWLFASHSSLEGLPEGLETEYLDIEHTPMTSLPRGMKGKEMHMSYTQIKQLPEGLEAEFLIISNSQVKELPQDIKVKELYVDEEQFDLFKDNLPPGVESINC